jgi:PAS domain-containing protein
LSLSAGVAAAAEPFNWSPQVDDPIHTPAELVESMHSAFGYNHCRAVHAKGIIFEGAFEESGRTRRARAEEVLPESEEHFRILADAAPVMIWMSGVGKL